MTWDEIVALEHEAEVIAVAEAHVRMVQRRARRRARLRWLTPLPLASIAGVDR